VVLKSATGDLTWGGGEIVNVVYGGVRTSGRGKECLNWISYEEQDRAVQCNYLEW